MRERHVRQTDDAIKQRRFNFAINCLNKAMKNNPNRNFVLSPPTIYEALIRIYYLIQGGIENRLNRILFSNQICKSNLVKFCSRKTEKQEKWTVYSWHCISDVRLWSLDKLFDFNRVAANFFHGAYESIDTLADKMLDNVNRVLYETVDGYILNPVIVSEANESNKYILMTSICYKNQNLSAHQINAPSPSFTNLDQINYYYKDLNMHVSDIPYENDMSLFIISPASLISGEWKITENISNTDLTNFVERLSTNEISDFGKMLSESRISMSGKKFTDSSIFVPFEIEKNLRMFELLNEFDIQLLNYVMHLNANYGEELYMRYSIKFKTIVHRAHVKFARREAILGATTLLHCQDDYSLYPERDTVNCNNSFVWLIYDSNQKEILFVGTCHNADADSQSVSQDKDQASKIDGPPRKKRPTRR